MSTLWWRLLIGLVSFFAVYGALCFLVSVLFLWWFLHDLKQERREYYEGLKQALFDHIELLYQEEN